MTHSPHAMGNDGTAIISVLVSFALM